MIRIVIVDDQAMVRTGLRALAERDGDIAVSGEAGNGDVGVSMVRQYLPDVVLMDIRMPGMDGLEATRRIVADERLREVRVVILTTFDSDTEVFAAIRAGAAGYLLKDIEPGELRAAIRTVAAGEALLSPAVTGRVMAQLAEQPDRRPRTELLESLTPREREVLARIGRGDSNAEIGRGLRISPETARTYVSRLLGKLDARDRSQLVIYAYESGLVIPGAD